MAGKAEASSEALGERQRAPASELELVYREHHAFVWRSLLRLGVAYEAVDDALHDAFLVVARRLHEFEGRSSRKTWLFAIAFQIARSYRRDRARSQRLSVALAHQGASGHASPHHGDRSEAASLLHRLLQQLDDEKRAVFVMAELEEMTAPEMAAVLGLKLPTVYSRLRLARARMEKAVALHRKQAEESGKRGVP